MLLFLPLGPDEPIPRAPRATIALVALNVLVFVFTARFDSARAALREAELEDVADWTLRQAADQSPALAARAPGPALAFLESDSSWRPLVSSADLRDRLEGCLEDHRALKTAHPFYRYGFVPAHVSLPRLFTHQFLHAGVLHLFFNMLFLWAVGGLLETDLGPAVFLPAYLAGGVAAALAHAVMNPVSVEPAIGASGAVAAAMGMFAVRHARARLRLALVAAPMLVPRIYFLAWPAWVFLALWLGEQLFFASFGSATLGIAFAAHLGGFAFGALIGLLLPR
jgi:membrane associated rhomboid family serine protease